MLLIRDVRVFDGVRLLEADTVLVEGDRIAGVGQWADLHRGERGRSAAARSYSGATLLPGLIDAHIHLELNPDNKSAPEASDAGEYPRMAERALAMVRAGITSARDLGGGRWMELALRDAIARGETLGPRLICSGQPITCPQGHCHFWGGVAEDKAQALAVLERQVRHGVDLIKVMATGGRLTRGSDPLQAQFDVDTVSAIVEAAREHDLHVAAHCHGTAGIEVAARAGVRTIEHCSWVGPDGWASDFQAEIADLILANGVWVSPTVNKGWQRMLDSHTGAVLNRVRAAYRAMLGKGIPFVASTDAGIPGVYHHELPYALGVFAAIAELNPEHVLRSATTDAALALGLTDTGAIREGMRADILVVDGDVLSDLSALTRPVAVWAAGKEVFAG
ncbi:MAG: amidohydrolase family protein [Pseudomonadales bacterium]|nr:amidohydrolase family protein [Pseudomonadales bacterium]